MSAFGTKFCAARLPHASACIGHEGMMCGGRDVHRGLCPWEGMDAHHGKGSSGEASQISQRTKGALFIIPVSLRAVPDVPPKEFRSEVTN